MSRSASSDSLEQGPHGLSMPGRHPGPHHARERVPHLDERGHEQPRLTASPSGAICDDEGEVEARCLVFYSLWIANHFIAADHGPRSRADVVKLALARLEA